MTQEDHIGRHVNIASHCIRRSLDAMIADCGLSGIQGRILHELHWAECIGRDVYQKDIEQRFGIRRSSVTSVITNLEDGGYLQRCAVPGDARLRKLVLTARGREFQQRFCDSIDRFEASLAEEFTEEEKAQLLSMLDRITKKLGGCTPHSGHEDHETCCMPSANTLT